MFDCVAKPQTLTVDLIYIKATRCDFKHNPEQQTTAGSSVERLYTFPSHEHSISAKLSMKGPLYRKSIAFKLPQVRSSINATLELCFGNIKVTETSTANFKANFCCLRSKKKKNLTKVLYLNSIETNSMLKAW